jgi:hypothetical protein
MKTAAVMTAIDNRLDRQLRARLSSASVVE